MAAPSPSPSRPQNVDCRRSGPVVTRRQPSPVTAMDLAATRQSLFCRGRIRKFRYGVHGVRARELWGMLARFIHGSRALANEKKKSVHFQSLETDDRNSYDHEEYEKHDVEMLNRDMFEKNHHEIVLSWETEEKEHELLLMEMERPVLADNKV
ncbi:hypothetical protein TIFTF001_020525 [Ficus carica]|uniref:Uncharacterized protein n=1 Tax=Ficus carica TaxID=3494 RepID=A0AA88A8R3_FICCA|nr:hypothetical protein TIFTF001_020525 [Ficus carica]